MKKVIKFTFPLSSLGIPVRDTYYDGFVDLESKDGKSWNIKLRSKDGSKSKDLTCSV